MVGPDRWNDLFRLAVVICMPALPGRLRAQTQSPLTLKSVIFETGALEGTPDATFGRLGDLAFSSSGALAVLDDITPALKVFADDGTLMASTGSEGNGPGEWSWPSSVDWLNQGELVVLSQGHHRLHYYRFDQGLLIHERDVTLGFVARDFCTLGERLFVLGLFEGDTVHEIGPTGSILSSFGPVMALDPELLGQWEAHVMQWTVDGRIMCDEERRMLLTVPFNLPFVSAFSADGAKLWETELAKYHQMRWLSLSGARGARVATDPATNTAHTARTASTVPGGHLLVQLLEWNAGTNLDSVAPESRFLSLDNGNEEPFDEPLPRIGAVGIGRAAVLTESPFPRLAVHATRR